GGDPAADRDQRPGRRRDGVRRRGDGGLRCPARVHARRRARGGAARDLERTRRGRPGCVAVRRRVRGARRRRDPRAHSMKAHSRPAALPPAERTVGQLVAESIRMYGERFLRALAIGVPTAALTAITAWLEGRERWIAELVAAPPLLALALVAAVVLALEPRLTRARAG